ncbi:MAG: hypothetical protein WCG36_10850, partial [bacterium]
ANSVPKPELRANDRKTGRYCFEQVKTVTEQQGWRIREYAVGGNCAFSCMHIWIDPVGSGV